MARSYIPHGVIPAVLLPFDPDLSIDEAALSNPWERSVHRFVHFELPSRPD